MMKLRALVPITHKALDGPVDAGDTFETDDVTGQWLVDHVQAERVKPTKKAAARKRQTG